jgi:hypothetical protein
MNISTLQSFLDQASIPKVTIKPKTFLEIARQPHYENVISNIYTFYFDPYEEHQLGDLFISSFLECIQLKNTTENTPLANLEEFEQFSDFLIDTEFGTQEKGRIDILLHNDTHAIIIENKIYHNLNNNLEDYWQTIERDDKEVKKVIGVVLSLKRVHSINHSGFVNITHFEFLNKVMSKIGSHLLQADEKYLTFLKDLYQNIENMSTQDLSTGDFTFYVKNQDKIDELVKFNKQALLHIKTQIIEAWHSFSECEVISVRENGDRWFVSRDVKCKSIEHLYFLIKFDKLVNSERKFSIHLLLKDKSENKRLYNKLEIQESLNNFSNLRPNKKPEMNHDIICLAEAEYVLSDTEFINLKDTVIKKINEDKFLDLIKELNLKIKEMSKSDHEMGKDGLDQ